MYLYEPVVVLHSLISSHCEFCNINAHQNCTDLRPFSSRPFAIEDVIEVVSLESDTVRTWANSGYDSRGSSRLEVLWLVVIFQGVKVGVLEQNVRLNLAFDRWRLCSRPRYFPLGRPFRRLWNSNWRGSTTRGTQGFKGRGRIISKNVDVRV